MKCLLLTNLLDADTMKWLTANRSLSFTR